MVDDDNNSVKPAENSPKRKLKENPPNKAEGPQLAEKVPPEKVPKNAHLSPAPPLIENSTETPPNKDYSPPKIENVSDLSKLKTLAEFGYTFNDKERKLAKFLFHLLFFSFMQFHVIKHL